MSFALLIVGAWLLIATARGSQAQLFNLLKGDFTGPNNFVYWFLAVIIVGAVGYVPRLKQVSDMFLALIIIVLVLKRGASNSLFPFLGSGGGGFFQQFTAAIQTTQSTNPQTGNSTSPLSFPFTMPSLSGSNSSALPGLPQITPITAPTFPSLSVNGL